MGCTFYFAYFPPYSAPLDGRRCDRANRLGSKRMEILRPPCYHAVEFSAMALLLRHSGAVRPCSHGPDHCHRDLDATLRVGVLRLSARLLVFLDRRQAPHSANLCSFGAFSFL